MTAWYEFRAYNSQTHYGFGVEAEAERYCDVLNSEREINLYAYGVVDDPDTLACLEAGSCGGINLDDELAAIDGLR